jgi:hypothetical protein
LDAAQHADSCYKLFGKSFYEVHRFLDQYWNIFPGFAHRRILHHSLGVDLVAERFGESAREPAELHIRQDTGGELPDDWSFYGEPILLDLDAYDKQDAELRRLYGDEVFERVQSKLE